MSNCPIFSAAAITELAWREASHLSDLVVEALTRERFEPAQERLRSHPDDYAGHRAAHEYRLGRVFKGQRQPAQLMLHYDLLRSGPPSEWEHGQQALMLVVYETRYSQGWQIEQLAFRTDGTFENPEVSRCLIAEPSSDGRLLVWGVDDQPLSRQAWFFAVPLASLRGPAAAEMEVISPLVAILRGTAPEQALKGTSAIRWPVRGG